MAQHFSQPIPEHERNALKQICSYDSFDLIILWIHLTSFIRYKSTNFVANFLLITSSNFLAYHLISPQFYQTRHFSSQIANQLRVAHQMQLEYQRHHERDFEEMLEIMTDQLRGQIKNWKTEKYVKLHMNLKESMINNRVQL